MTNTLLNGGEAAKRLIVNELNNLDFEIKDEDLEPFINYVLHKHCNKELDELAVIPKYFKVLFSIIKKNI
jgi:hypothetical protein